MSAHRIERFDEGEVVYIAIDPDGIWARSEFPHPLITVDYDNEENVIGISAVGPRVHQVLVTYTAWEDEDRSDPNELVSRLQESREPATA